MKLYSFVDFDRSARVRWTLHELGLPFEEVRLDIKKLEHKSPEFLKKNPFGCIPALEIGDDTLLESGAICSTLAERYPQSALAPAVDSPLRTAYNQWCYFACSTLEAVVMPVFRMKRTGMPSEAGQQRELTENMNRVLASLAAELQTNDFLLGTLFSTADILVGHTLGLLDRIGLLKDYPALQSYVSRLAAREAAQKSRTFSAPMEL